MIKAVVFDLDDTLYNYQKCNAIAEEKLRQYVCNKYNLKVNEFIKTYAESKKYVKNRLGNVAASHNRLLYMQHFLELIGERPAVDALHMYDIYWNCMLDSMELFAGVLRVLDDLRSNGIKIGILTDLTAHIQHRKIQNLGIEKYVDAFVTSEEAGAEKPDKRMFNLIMQKLGVEPIQALFLGDSMEKDIIGAKQIGAHAQLVQGSTFFVNFKL